MYFVPLSTVAYRSVVPVTSESRSIEHVTILHAHVRSQTMLTDILVRPMLNYYAAFIIANPVADVPSCPHHHQVGKFPKARKLDSWEIHWWQRVLSMEVLCEYGRWVQEMDWASKRRFKCNQGGWGGMLDWVFSSWAYPPWRGNNWKLIICKYAFWLFYYGVNNLIVNIIN